MIAGRRVVVVKIGTSSLTDERGAINAASIAKLCAEIAQVRGKGDRVVLVTSGAIAAGLPVLGLGDVRPTDAAVLQAASAVGQSRLLGDYDRALATHGLVGGQILLSPNDFFDRRQYLHARQTLSVLLDLGVVPIVNENDAVADDEIRFGDNDRLAALVAHLVRADLLVLLTDTPGLLSADPRSGEPATLIEEIVEFDHELDALAGGAGSVRGSGGMASKLSSAKIAAWSGVRAVIASADREGVLVDAAAGVAGVGTVVVGRQPRLGARKLWIAFAVGARGRVRVDEGARRALLERGVSLLPAGVTGVEGDFDADDAVEVAGPAGGIFAKGLVRHPAAVVKELAGRRTASLPEGVVHEVIHRDDLVLLP
ncbi:MAG TPA: glutamate 5-kinase [Acidimicrobiales bacterium]|nr:glutamate 5-kinase [Acidimicrobiales bacterium]